MKPNRVPEEFITGSEPMPTHPHGTLAKRDPEGPGGPRGMVGLGWGGGVDGTYWVSEGVVGGELGGGNKREG